MKNKKIMLIITIASLLICSSITSAAIGYIEQIKIGQKDESIKEDYIFNNYSIYLYPEYVAKEKYPDQFSQKEEDFNNEIKTDFSNNNYQKTTYKSLTDHPIQVLSNPMDSPWPMYCHDVRHTGRSPYSTINTNNEIWKFETQGWAEGGPTIDENGTIYIGSWFLYAIYPNGSLKWVYPSDHIVGCAPTIDESGVIYYGTIYGDDRLYAINPDGTKRWSYYAGGDIFSSPSIDNNGIIYFGSGGGYPPTGNINALYPNGSLKWKFNANHVVYSSPSIGQDGTIYCGSHDTYLYALYSNNGSLKWKYKTGDWIRTSPCVADDGTIHVVSLDNYLYAIYTNGTLKWKTYVGAGTSPTIGQDGTIYAGHSTLYAVNPINGSVKWTFPIDGTIRGGTPCNSIDGTIFVGTSEGGELIAINSDGSLKWRNKVGTIESPPAIGEDGSVYFGTNGAPGVGYLNAFGELNTNEPSAPTIDGETSGTVGVPYTYTLTSTSPIGNSLYYYIDWGDGSIDDWFGPYHSGEEAQATHTWSNPRTYTIKARANDTDGLLSKWGELQIVIPKNKKIIPQTYPNTKESNPILSPLLQKFLLYFY